MTGGQADRRRRGLVAAGVVAAALLAGAALLGWLGRPGGDSDGGSRDGSPTAVSAAADPAATGAAGGENVDGGGFSHDEIGAVEAAVSFTVAWRHGWPYLGDDQLADAVAQIAAPSSVDTLVAQVLEDTRPSREQLAGSASSASWVDPLAWRVESCNNAQARVAVWTMTTLAAPSLAVPQSEWTTVTVDLAWVEGGWRVVSLSSRWGPTPMTSSRDDPWDTARFVAALEGFSRPGAPRLAAWDRGGRPVGGAFAHDEDGAAAAALAYTAAPQRWLYLSDQQVAEAVAQIAAPRSVERLVAEVVDEAGTSRAELAKSEGPVWWWVDPLAWRVESYSDHEASVAVWTATVLSAQGVAVPQSEWMTVTVDLEWVEGGWRVAAIGDRPGPTPILSARDDPWDAVPFAETLRGFTRLGEEPAT